MKDPPGGLVVADDTLVDSFTTFVKETERRLKHALSVGFGAEAGGEATAEALAYGWEHWDRIRDMENPAGYLYRVGKRRARRTRLRFRPVFPPVPPDHMPWVEPGLPEALSRLSEQQRVAVWLVCGFEWTYSEVAELLGLRLTTVQNHVERALGKLRKGLGGSG